ncbi:hypothetical protein D3233_13135 [Staphylococcus aureus]|uniref:Uncharacterized protein n=1 Tax=Staphylococcus aureus subsp. aureus DR10 TaxID=1155079 RepID=A0ABC9PY78_STAA5|nr:hypothetical protein ST398NM01_2828 [Staphylococcus aureus subsp. aureus 71193]AFR72644.1 putative membrane protein [Staphylococcus aureus 08BA02176]ARH65961.1 hypothetical protein BXP64_02750 [Staphylococcus aureus]EIA13305.1 hypothetical protein ST398NM02_2828 [Staphylococcus aureus subsp. aureus DR10]UER51090.1 hypothetical protein CAC37_02820 [Staphylococcus aureus subsp. aureus ST398]
MSNAINIETLTFNIIIENTNLNRLGDLFVSVIAIAITSFLYIHIVTSYLIKNMVLQYQIYLGLKFDFYNRQVYLIKILIHYIMLTRCILKFTFSEGY